MILSKSVYFRLVNLLFFPQKRRNFQNRSNMHYKSFINILDANFQVPITHRFQILTYLLSLTKNVSFRLVKLAFFTQNIEIKKKSFQHASEVLINIADINFEVPITYRFRNPTYLVILTKNIYFRWVKLTFLPKKIKFRIIVLTCVRSHH